jgi:hypothetical protein
LAAITNQLTRLSNTFTKRWVEFALLVFQVVVVFELGRRSGWWWVAALVVVAIELRDLRPGGQVEAGQRAAALWERLPGLIMGLSVTLVVALMLREATQLAVVVLYGAWLAWREFNPREVSKSLVQLLVIQAVMFEAIFLMAAMWQTPSWLTLVLVWAGAYGGVYATLKSRGDRSAGVMAATWGVIATEVAWVLQLWLITYAMRGGFVLVPQPALILTALAYVFGSVLASSRQGNLSRARLAEYMLIALVLVVIVVVGTSWRGNV